MVALKVKDIIKIYEPRPSEVSVRPLTIWLWDEISRINIFDDIPKRYLNEEVIRLVAMGDNHIQLVVAPKPENKQLSLF